MLMLKPRLYNCRDANEHKLLYSKTSTQEFLSHIKLINKELLL